MQEQTNLLNELAQNQLTTIEQTLNVLLNRGQQ